MLGHVRKVVQRALANADVPFQQVVDDASVPRSTAYSPLFQTLITVDEGAADSLAEMAAAGAEAMEVWRRADHTCVNPMLWWIVDESPCNVL